MIKVVLSTRAIGNLDVSDVADAVKHELEGEFNNHFFDVAVFDSVSEGEVLVLFHTDEKLPLPPALFTAKARRITWETVEQLIENFDE